MDSRTEQQSSLHKLLADAIPLAIFLTDEAGFVSGWTGSAERLLGYAKPDVMGRKFETFFEPTHYAAHHEARWVELADRASNFREIGRATRADGSRFLAVFTMDRVTDRRGRAIAYACTLGPV
jgi:PAS domain S-box-containing protein